MCLGAECCLFFAFIPRQGKLCLGFLGSLVDLLGTGITRAAVLATGLQQSPLGPRPISCTSYPRSSAKAHRTAQRALAADSPQAVQPHELTRTRSGTWLSVQHTLAAPPAKPCGDPVTAVKGWKCPPKSKGATTLAPEMHDNLHSFLGHLQMQKHEANNRAASLLLVSSTPESGT